MYANVFGDCLASRLCMEQGAGIAVEPLHYPQTTDRPFDQRAADKKCGYGRNGL